MKKKNFVTIRVAVAPGDFLPEGGVERLKADNIDKAISLLKELQFDDIRANLFEEFEGDSQEADDNFSYATEFYNASGIVQEGVGWLESGEKSIVLVVEEGNKWYERLLSTTQWSETVWDEFNTLLSEADEPLM